MYKQRQLGGPSNVGYYIGMCLADSFMNCGASTAGAAGNNVTSHKLCMLHVTMPFANAAGFSTRAVRFLLHIETLSCTGC